MDFDGAAATWDDDEARARRTRDVADAMRRRLASRSWCRALDFGAGTGALSLLLADLFDEVVLVDTSLGMLEVARGKIRALDAGQHARLVTRQMDLTAGDVLLEPFDVVYSLMALHHVADVSALLDTLRNLANPGARLLIADLAAEDGSYHADDSNFGGHHGFDEHVLRSELAASGWLPLSHSTVHVVHRAVDGLDRAYPVFLAEAERTD